MHGALFKQEKISFSYPVLQSLRTDELLSISDTSQPSAAVPADNTSSHHQSSLHPESSSSADTTTADTATVEDDSRNELTDSEVDRAGVYDTLFSSPDFVEDTERAAVSRAHINSSCSDHVYSFAPAEGKRPISIFLDTHSEELSYPNIFGVMAVQKVTQLKFIAVSATGTDT